MNKPIEGVTPAELSEVTCKVVWPTIGATAAGRLVGRLAAVRIGCGQFFTLGKLLALASIPLSVAVFCWQLLPYVARRYAVSNRRIVIRKGLLPMDQRWIELDRFETIDIEVLPGQEWLHAGDLVFRHDGNEVLRLQGVSRPEVFRQVCLTVRNALAGTGPKLRPEPAMA
ncbi:MAG: PH domain-containing protein [Planctomycetaceae bacterium]|nr:PH domain-containing protein [Planctomycetaceae bacterium]